MFIDRPFSSSAKKLRKFARQMQAYMKLRSEFHIFLQSGAQPRGFSMRWNERLLIAGEDTAETVFDPHYLYHPAWAARILAKTKPAKHIDISSILHFSTLVSAFIPVEFYDYRPARVHLPNLMIDRADLTKLPFPTNSVESISCMHTVEHVGLGRYGDPLDPDGDLRAMKELVRVTRPGGTILFVAPIGKPKIVFNAHRIYSYEQVMSYFGDSCELKDFFLISDNAATQGPIEHAAQADADAQKYGCGCFWFIKKVS